MVTLDLVQSQRQIAKTADLADKIWNEYYPVIIGQSQVVYMLANYQSMDAISTQINNGQLYFLIKLQHQTVGYLSIVSEEGHGALQLSKLYLLKSFRRQGIAKYCVQRVREIALGKGASLLWLTVNRYNAAAISAYEKLGFVTTMACVEDIGDSFVMDDFRMELQL